MQYEKNGRTHNLKFYVSGPQGSMFGSTYRADDVVPIWLSVDEARLTPPSQVELFQWFPYLHLAVGIATAMAYLFAGALIYDYKRIYKQPLS